MLRSFTTILPGLATQALADACLIELTMITPIRSVQNISIPQQLFRDSFASRRFPNAAGVSSSTAALRAPMAGDAQSKASPTARLLFTVIRRMRPHSRPIVNSSATVNGKPEQQPAIRTGAPAATDARPARRRAANQGRGAGRHLDEAQGYFRLVDGAGLFGRGHIGKHRSRRCRSTKQTRNLHSASRRRLGLRGSQQHAGSADRCAASALAPAFRVSHQPNG